MTTIGIRELRQHASKYLAMVREGESIDITDRGRRVARLVPVRKSRLEEMIEAGDATKAKGDLLHLGPPLPPKPGVPLPSEVLEQMRTDER